MVDKSDFNRRAEDTSEWNEYLNEEINWAKTFLSLGGHFTTRILLRRGLYHEIEKWVNSEDSAGEPNLKRILNDCEITLKTMIESNEPPKDIELLDRIISIIKERMSAS